MWEAVYLIDSLLQNPSTAQPEQIHADTQGQSFPVFGLAHLLGIDLLPRIRNFQDLTFHRPDPQVVRYRHIDPLFSTDPRTTIDWDLIRRHWPDLMQVALSVKAGTVSSVTLLRRLNHRSRKNQIYQAFREIGRAVRTAVLLRYLSDPALREQIQRATNKAEPYNGFTKWLHFGNAGWLTSRDPELQDKAVKFLDLAAASVIFSTTIDMTCTLRHMVREGWTLNASALAVLTPLPARKRAPLRQLHHRPTPPPPCLQPHPPHRPGSARRDSHSCSARGCVSPIGALEPPYLHAAPLGRIQALCLSGAPLHSFTSAQCCPVCAKSSALTACTELVCGAGIRAQGLRKPRQQRPPSAQVGAISPTSEEDGVSPRYLSDSLPLPESLLPVTGGDSHARCTDGIGPDEPGTR